MRRESREDLVREVLECYDLGAVRRVEPHGGTAARNWRVETAGGAWLLRTRGARTSSDEAIAFDHALRRHLVSRGVPTAAPLARRDGQTFTRLAGRAYEVYPFVAGLSRVEASAAQLQSAARGLAGFHRAAADFPLARSAPPLAQYATLGIPDMSERPEDPALLSCAYVQLAAGAQAGRFAEAAGCCLEWLRRLQEEFGPVTYNRLPHVLTHGDYTLANLLFDECDVLVGVFDFDWARWAPRVRDLADGMYFIGAVRRTPLDPGDIWSLTETADFNVERCVLWLCAYGEAERLEPEEIQTLPLAFGARWLSVRIEGTAKVPAKERARFFFRDVVAPLQWLDRNWGQVEAALT
jgi:Ser/Thr protein kinase RdoA (MazF antagonist)